MNASQLRSFHAVALTGSFTAAAKKLHITQPAVTTQVKMLENHYDVELFHRSRRGCVLTQFGESLFELTRQMNQLDEEASALLASMSGELRGTIRLYADGPFHSIGILTNFRERYPMVQIKLTVGNSAAVGRKAARHQRGCSLGRAVEASPWRHGGIEAQHEAQAQAGGE